MTQTCPCCAGARFERLLDFGSVPVSGLFRADPAEHLPSALLAFELCTTCGLVRQEKETTLRDYSTINRTTARQFPMYGDELIANLESLGVGPGEFVLEIGSNDGSFLKRLHGGGFRQVVGVEPASRLAEQGRARGFEIVNDYFGLELVPQLLTAHGPVRAVVCRQTLEHVPDPSSFLVALRECLDYTSGIALIEVPDSTAIPERLNVHELWDEHLYYFTVGTLVRLMARAGMTVFKLEIRPHLDTRNLLAWCRVDAGGSPSRSTEGYPDYITLWRGLPLAWDAYRRRLAEALGRASRPLYLIGASHPQCNFANYARIGALVNYCIDDDPTKVGRFPPVAGSHPTIISTEQFEATARAGTVLNTGFGYPEWSARICDHAAKYGMQVLYPCEFVGSSPDSQPVGRR